MISGWCYYCWLCAFEDPICPGVYFLSFFPSWDDLFEIQLPAEVNKSPALIPCFAFTLALCHIDTNVHMLTHDPSLTGEVFRRLGRLSEVVLSITAPSKVGACVFLTSVTFTANKLNHRLSLGMRAQKPTTLKTVKERYLHVLQG